MKTAYTTHLLLACSAMILSACGGGSSTTSTEETATTPTVIEAETATITGSVPGTLIEAYCDGDIYKFTRSIQNGTSQHPFELTVPKEISCRLVMTTNEDDPENRVITHLTFKDTQGNESNLLRVLQDEVDLGYIDLPMSPANTDDTNNDHVKDTPLSITLTQPTIEVITDETDELDRDDDDILDIYEDDDNDGIVNKYDTNLNQTTTPTTTVTTSNYYALEDWRKPRIYAKGAVIASCNQDKVFSLRPHKDSIEARLVDFTLGTTADAIHPSGYTLRATQARDSNSVIPLTFDSATKKWTASCAPIVYKDKTDIYPAYWIEAVSDANGSVVTKDKITLYDGGTDNCMACHASNSQYPLAYASSGPANLADPEEDFKTNILRKHDEKHPDAVSKLQTQLQAKGLSYNTAGLAETAKTMRVSCTDCHGINGVQGSGLSNVPALTNAIHRVHANLSEPNIMGANNCLTCHPGETIAKTFNGMIVHPFTAAWRSEDGHGEWADNMGVESCTLCHGRNLQGTQISNNVSCYKCHGKEWNDPVIGTWTPTSGTLSSVISDNDDEDDD